MIEWCARPDPRQWDPSHNIQNRGNTPCTNMEGLLKKKISDIY